MSRNGNREGERDCKDSVLTFSTFALVTVENKSVCLSQTALECLQSSLNYQFFFSPLKHSTIFQFSKSLL